MSEQVKLTGPATLDYLPEITLKGNSYERGFQYGRAMSVHLDKFYYWFVGKEPADVITWDYNQYLEFAENITAKYFPQILEEIKGWSDGAKLSYEKCRILAFHNDVKYLLGPGCSNLVVTKSPIGPWFARNVDLFENERSWQVMRRCYCDDCYSHSGIGYLGLLGTQGSNSAGLVVGGSSLPSKIPEIRERFPNFLLYLTQTKATVDECREELKKIGHLAKVHVCLLDKMGDALAAELGAGMCVIREPDKEGILIATNH